MTSFVTRFAPSPTGYLHLGHAFSAMTAAHAARDAGGRFLLRIEDIDPGRCRPEYETAIYDDLAWLGLAWPTPVRRQSEHSADYAAALQTLIDAGLAYRCFRTRKEVLDEIARAPHLPAAGPEGPQFSGAPLSPAEERVRIGRGEPFAWRLSLAAARERLGAAFHALAFVEEAIGAADQTEIKARPEIFGDAVIARKDAGTSYHLASVHDDALQGVTHVIRGEDLAAAAHLHVLLQALLGWPTPVYRHHPLIVGPDGRKFSKRDAAPTLRNLRGEGTSPAAIPALRSFHA